MLRSSINMLILGGFLSSLVLPAMATNKLQLELDQLFGRASNPIAVRTIGINTANANAIRYARPDWVMMEDPAQPATGPFTSPQVYGDVPRTRIITYDAALSSPTGWVFGIPSAGTKTSLYRFYDGLDRPYTYGISAWTPKFEVPGADDAPYTAVADFTTPFKARDLVLAINGIAADGGIDVVGQMGGASFQLRDVSTGDELVSRMARMPQIATLRAVQIENLGALLRQDFVKLKSGKQVHYHFKQQKGIL